MCLLLLPRVIPVLRRGPRIESFFSKMFCPGHPPQLLHILSCPFGQNPSNESSAFHVAVSTFMEYTLPATVSFSLLTTCPNHRSRPSFSLSEMGATLILARTVSLGIRSRRVTPMLHLSIFISMTLSACSCRAVVGQHSVL